MRKFDVLKLKKISKRGRLRVLILLLIGILVSVSALWFSSLSKTKPNDDIFFLDTNSGAILGNKNPTFNVSFGKRDEPEKQWVRFEAQVSSQNPFEGKNENLFTKLADLFKREKEYGIEMSLNGVVLSETEKLDLDGKEEVIKTVADILGTDDVRTSTELIESGRVIGEYSEEAVSKKSVLNKNVADGVDIEYQILEGLGLKEEIVIRNLDEYTKGCGEDLMGCKLPLNEFNFDLKLDEGLELRKGWLTLKGGSTQTYYFTDKDGNYVAHFLPNWAIDSAGEKTYDVPMQVEDAGGGNYRIKVIVDIEWLFSPGRVYPIRIDPSIVHDTKNQFDQGIFDRTNSSDDPAITITNANNFLHEIYAFTSDGTFSPPLGVTEVKVLVVGGGGGGGSSGGSAAGAGGGGAGGLVWEDSYVFSSLEIEEGVPITVGSGGSGGASGDSNGQNGGDSTFGTLTAIGGGGGGHRTSNGGDGGSGGGVGGATVTPGSGTVGQGHDGGNGTTSGDGSAGGGGGAGEAGYDFISGSFGGAGGVGIYLGNMLGDSLGDDGWFAGGGGGGATVHAGGTGGKGGGGTGGVSTSNAQDGVAGTGGGGGGGGRSGSSGGSGGSGIVIIAIPKKHSYGQYISPVIDFEDSYYVEHMSLDISGVHTGGGENMYSTVGLEAQWNFNEIWGDVAENNDGTCGSSCNANLVNFSNTLAQDILPMSGWTYINRKWGNGSIMIDGVDDYINLTTPIFTAENGSFSFWFRKDIAPSFLECFFGYFETSVADSCVGINDEGKIVIEDLAFASNISSEQSYADGEWHHVVVNGNYTGDTLELWVDGILISTSKWEQPAYMTTQLLGARYNESTGTPENLFRGMIDTVVKYNRPLLASEILSNYQSGNVEFRYRTSNDGSTWGVWEGGEEADVDITQDYTKWSDSVSDTRILQLSNDSNIKVGVNDSLRVDSDYTKVDTVNGLVGLWHLDEESGSGAYLLDYSDNDNHGTPNGTTYVEGKIGGARDFDGSSDYISTDFSSEASSLFADSSGSWTVEAWFKHKGGMSSDGVIVGRGGGTGTSATFGIFVNSSGALRTVLRGSYTTLMSNVANDQWCHVVVTWTGGEARGYVNGEDVGTLSVGSASLQSNNLVIGATNNGSSARYRGQIDEVRVYETARSGKEVAESYRMGKNHYVYSTLETGMDLSESTKIPFWIASDKLGSNIDLIVGNSPSSNYLTDSNVVGLWKMDEMSGSGAYINDSSGNDNHATPSGTTYTEGRVGGARYFNGTSDYMLTSDFGFDYDNITIEAWVKPEDLSGRRTLLDLGAETTLVPQLEVGTCDGGSNAICVVTPGVWQAQTVDNVISEGEWVHIAYTKEGTGATHKIYVNGVEQPLVTNNSETYSSTSVGKNIGRRGDNTQFFNGNIDELRISDIVRTGEVIREAYEITKRKYSIKIDFKADLQLSNLISDSNDLSFTISETSYGTTKEIENLSLSDRIIIKEYADSAEYIAQGVVDSINEDTGAVTVEQWELGSTFPSGGYSEDAVVFKWQEEIFDIRDILDTQRDDISTFMLVLNNQVGANYWIDGIRSAKYLAPLDLSQGLGDPTQYFQYKIMFSTYDEYITPTLNKVQIDYTSEILVEPPLRRIMRHGKWFYTGEEQPFWWAQE
jgi:hypothetical protein